MNVVTLTGRLTKNPETSFTPTGTCKCTFTLAVDREFKKNENDNADYPRIIVWGATAENCGRYLERGQQAEVVGRLQTGSYKDRNGTTVFTTDVVADRVKFGAKPKNAQSNPANSAPEQGYEGTGFSGVEEPLPWE